MLHTLHFRSVFVWAIMFSILAGWLVVRAHRFDGDAPAGMATQQAELPADADPAEMQRKALSAFKEFARLQTRWDVGFLAYYHPQAAIHLRRLLPDGSAETTEYSTRAWKSLQKHWASSTAASEDRTDTPAYNGIRTRIEGNLVIIEGRRRVDSIEHNGPYKAALVQAEDGEWRIIEEWIESRLYAGD
jgi:hypothetical protein